VRRDDIDSDDNLRKLSLTAGQEEGKADMVVERLMSFFLSTTDRVERVSPRSKLMR